MKAAFSRVFTLEVDGRPILAFQAGAIVTLSKSAKRLGFMATWPN